MEIKYSVGQILFAIDNKRFNITPFQITEHHVKTSLEGTENSYFAVSGRSKEAINLSALKGPIFETLENAESYLTQIAVERIKKLVKEAENISQKSFNVTLSSETKQETPLTPDDVSGDEDIVVELPDGRQAKLSKGGAYENFSG